MKYGESTFDILYLIFAIAGGCLMLAKARNRTEKQPACPAEGPGRTGCDSRMIYGGG